MATQAPSHGVDGSSGLQHQPVDWGTRWYNDSSVGIIASTVVFSPNDGDTVVADEVNLRLLFHVITIQYRESEGGNLRVFHVNSSTVVQLPLSQLSHLRRLIFESVLSRPDLEDGGYVDFVSVSVGDYVRDRQQRILSFNDGVQGTRRVQELRVEVVVVIDVPVPVPSPPAPHRPVPQLKRVVYGEELDDEGGRRSGRAPRAPEVRETACPICLQDFSIGEEVGMTPCAHPFHPACLARWLERTPLCPLCRSTVPSVMPPDSDQAPVA